MTTLPILKSALHRKETSYSLYSLVNPIFESFKAHESRPQPNFNMANPHNDAEYKVLLDSKGEPSLDDAESHYALEHLQVKKAKSLNPYSIWIFHIAMVILYSTVLGLIAWKQYAQYYHGPGLISCTSIQSKL